MLELRQGSATALWHELVFEGERRSGLALDENSESYLVFALMRHLSDRGLLKRIMALELLAADEVWGQRRVDELRDVGDRCLLIAGLFPGLAARRRVDSTYFANLGRSAYRCAASADHGGHAALFDRLAAVFHQLVRVLKAAAGLVPLQTAEQALLAGGNLDTPRAH